MKIFRTNRTEAILDMIRAGQSQENAEMQADLIFNNESRELLEDCRYYLTGDELITTEEFKDGIEADYGIGLMPVILG